MLAGLAALGSAAQAARGQAESAAAEPARTMPFHVGERFEYRVKLGLFTVGRATMAVLGVDTVRGEPTWRVMFTLRGRALMYSLNDSLQSWFGVRDFASRRFIQDNEENGRHRFRRYEIYPARGIWVRNDTDTGATVADPLDDASFFYFARTVPLEVGRSYEFHRYFRQERNPVVIRVLQRQETGVPAGRFRTIVVRPIFQSRGIFAQGGEAYVWFTDDERRIPVRIRSRLPFGTLEMQLTAIR
jgi:hypothetical protein